MKKSRADHDILSPSFVGKVCIKKPLNKFFDQTFWKFILVGILNTVFGTGIMFVFYNVFHFNYWLSSASNYFFGIILSYILNRLFTFKNNTETAKTLPKFVIHISLCYLIAYGMVKPIISGVLSAQPKNLQENAAMLVGMGIFVFLNYIGQKFFVFKERT